MNFKEKVFQTISHNLLPGTDVPVLVALSGGPDSVAALRVLLALGYSCEAAHCNFHLRGGESERDEKFVRNLCEKLDVRLHVVQFDTRKYASENKISIEMAARDLRYGFFNDLLDSTQAEYVVVAHHRDDNAETLLLNLVRGTGLRGLCGMQYMNGNVIRPLLDVSRDDIMDYLKSLDQDYVTDSTNLEADVMRNKIRLKVLPLLRELNPSVDETLHRVAGKLREAETMYRYAVNTLHCKITVCKNGDEILKVSDIMEGASVESVLYEWLFPKGFNETQIFDAYSAMQKDTKVHFESSDYMLFFERGSFCLAKKDSFPDPYMIDVLGEGKISLADGRTMTVRRCENDMAKEELKNPKNAYLDVSNLKYPLAVRAVRNGDKFIPFGMKGSKLVSDYLCDKKVPEQERLRQLVVVDREKIVWLVGHRVDDRVKVSTTTKELVHISVK